MGQQNSLKKKTIRGLLWSFGDLMGNQGMQFIIQIILARMLLPEHFGLIGMIIVFVAVSNSIVDSGFTQALIREQNTTQTDYSTVFYFNLAVSILIYILIYLMAPSVSVFFGEPELVSLLRVLALGILINAFGIIPRAMLTKEVNFKAQAKVNMASSIISGLVAVGMAAGGFGVWSLVIRTLVMNLIQSLLLVLSKKWVPSLTFSIISFKRLFGFGWKLLVSGLIDTIFVNIYFVIIGRQYSTGQLGYYTNASKFSDMSAQSLSTAIQRVTYPVLSSIKDEKDRLKQSYRKIIKMSAFIIFPIMIGFVVIAEPLIHLLFGEQWLPMVPYFQLLCIGAMLYPIHALNLNILQVKGRSDLYLKLEIFKMIIASILIFLAIWLDLGIFGLVGAAVLSSYTALFINTYYSGREISYSVSEQLRDLIPIYAVAVIMGICTYVAGELLLNGSFIAMLIQIIMGVTFYLTFSKLAKIEELGSIFHLILPVIKKINPIKIN
ncbi:lipopolysaccharide biosynthesis protein [Planococcus salinarum]|uniref:lipopolysaccharide biosynthesis protein n=1 Tax=Planococcus salinarum TaxID=622695 RepID=UPI000E3E3C86|nr:lipopolysaccharide biosynthesis protein [Planococcus salinarum]TAA72305.1 lipopolysaccharide biosynthesis protein [Planococcus salinarum]